MKSRAVFILAEKASNILPTYYASVLGKILGEKKSYDCRDVIVFKKLRFHVFCPAHFCKRKASLFKFF